ncbi:hypothetical protein Z043_120085 [Scleropages formosus]|uniref:Uncharacterized protein n=1 Tax=Scleropages formosus TaxID=113540 RepID=A0A0P7U426_SCLFO|nr:hypothetical protein Z043_120085 [Scleropages formosus]
MRFVGRPSAGGTSLGEEHFLLGLPDETQLPGGPVWGGLPVTPCRIPVHVSRNLLASKRSWPKPRFSTSLFTAVSPTSVFTRKVECKKAQPKEVMFPPGTRGRARGLPYTMDAFMLGMGMLSEYGARGPRRGGDAERLQQSCCTEVIPKGFLPPVYLGVALPR